MSLDQEWLSRRDVLADRLRLFRERTGKSGKDFAACLGWQASKVSRIETGRQMPSATDIEAWVHTAARPDALHDVLALLDEVRAARSSFRRRMREGQQQVQLDYGRLIAEAKVVRYFETCWVPGILQTADYARRVFTEMVELQDLAVDDVDAAVTARLRWQHHLYDLDKRFEFLLAEPVLRWVLPSRPAMRGQLDRLQTVIGLPNIRFGVIPLGRELRAAPQNAVQMYDELVITETFIGETQHRDEEAAVYARSIDRLWGEAVEGEQARELIIAAIRSL